MLAFNDHGGHGPILVLVHGFLGSGRDWHGILPALQAHYRCITVDLPGHGASSACDSIRGIDDVCGLLHRTLSQGLAIPRFSLLGYSLGGRVAMAYACAYPEHIDRLFLEGAHPGLENDGDRLLRRQQDKLWAQRFATEALVTVLYDWYQQPVFASMTGLARSALVMERCADNGHDEANQSSHWRGLRLAEMLSCCGLSEQKNYRGLLRYLSSKMFSVAYLVGEKDLKFRRLADSLIQNSDIEMRIVTGAGHNAHRDNPVGFIQALLA